MAACMLEDGIIAACRLRAARLPASAKYFSPQATKMWCLQSKFLHCCFPTQSIVDWRFRGNTMQTRYHVLTGFSAFTA